MRFVLFLVLLSLAGCGTSHIHLAALPDRAAVCLPNDLVMAPKFHQSEDPDPHGMPDPGYRVGPRDRT